MITCSACGKQNRDHYKFCLGCGAELPQEQDPPADNTDLSINTSTENTVSGSPDVKVQCPNCGSENPAEFMFCGSCGGRMRATRARLPKVDDASGEQAGDPIARLALIRPDGSRGETQMLLGPEATIGRATGALFAQDPYLNPQHARITRDGDHLKLEDLNSRNGVLVRITEPETVTPGDVFRIGQELLRIDHIEEPAAEDDGTMIMGSPNPGYWGRITLIVGPDEVGSAFPLMGDEMVLGRERGDILFSDDGYVSGTHAKISVSGDGNISVTDLGSSNGTFIRISQTRTVPFGCFVLMGQQLFRLESPT